MFSFPSRSSGYEPRVSGGSKPRQGKAKTHSRQTGTRPTATASACLALPTPSTSEQLLLELVREIVPGLEDAPFLQLRYAKGVSRREKVPDALVSSPNVWGAIADSLEAEPATTIAFVRQLARGAGPHVDEHAAGCWFQRRLLAHRALLLRSMSAAHPRSKRNPVRAPLGH